MKKHLLRGALYRTTVRRTRAGRVRFQNYLKTNLKLFEIAFNGPCAMVSFRTRAAPALCMNRFSYEQFELKKISLLKLGLSLVNCASDELVD